MTGGGHEDHSRLDVLIARTPLSARVLVYVGGGAEAFQAACLRRNPRVAFAADGADVVILQDLADLARPEIMRALAAGVTLVAAVTPGDRETVETRLGGVVDAGLEVLELQPSRAGETHYDDAATNLADAWRSGGLDEAAACGGLVLVARRPTTPEAAPLMQIRMAVYAPQIMDIRTHLPMGGLRSEADLLVALEPPLQAVPRAPPAAPKVMILQRPALADLARWRAGAVAMIGAGWIQVMELDDHPALIAAANDQALAPAVWTRLGYMHAVQTSTPALAEALGSYNPEVKVFPNTVFDLPPFAPQGRPRVFYGAVSRGTFAVEAARALGPALRAHPDVEVVVVGDRAVFEALPTRAKTFHDYLPYEAYLETMAGCAISLAPLEGAPHQETKSDAKFLDAASRGLLTIASPTVYADTIRHGETGLIARGLDDWAPLLAGALDDAQARVRMAHAAWRYVRDHRMFAAQVAERRAWYRELWDRREALNSALLQRINATA